MTIFWSCYGSYNRKSVKHFLDYVTAEIHRHTEEKLYRVYMTNSIRGAVRGEMLKYQYIDLLNGTTPTEDTRTGTEIAADIISKYGLRFEE